MGRVGRPGPDGDRLVLRYSDPEGLAGWLVGYGADVEVLEPPEVRDAVIPRLRRSPPGTPSSAVGRTAGRSGRRRAAAAPRADRLARLLNLVPYLLARPGIGIAQAAAELDITERQLREDLELLWVCGLPGYGPGDLIDMAFDGDNVTITYDAGIDRPLRLTPDEALALVVALRMLAEMPGHRGRDAIERALAKIEAAAGDVAEAPVAVRMPGHADRSTIRARRERRGRCGSRYYTATRDKTSERVIDPMRVLVVEGRAYVEAWCRQAEAVRLFRVDRIDGFTELESRPRRRPRPCRRTARGRVPARRRAAAGHAAREPERAVDHRVLPVRAVAAPTASSGWSRCG